jgi:hypothetical protein
MVNISKYTPGYGIMHKKLTPERVIFVQNRKLKKTIDKCVQIMYNEYGQKIKRARITVQPRESEYYVYCYL